MKEKINKNMACNASCGGAGGALYFVGFIGAIIYFWPLANGFWDYVLVFIQSVFWPAFMVYELFKFLEIGLL